MIFSTRFNQWVIAILSALTIYGLTFWIIQSGENATLLIISLLIVILSGFLMLRFAGGFVWNSSTVFFLYFIVFTYYGGMYFFLNNGAGIIYGGGERNYAFYIAIHGGLVCMLFGMLIANLLFNFSPRQELLNFREKIWIDDIAQYNHWIAFSVVAAIALVLAGIFIAGRGSIPLIKVIMSQSSENIQDIAFEARAQFSRYGRGTGAEYSYQGYFQQINLIIIPLLALFCGAKYLMMKEWKFLILWLLFAGLAGLNLAASIQRWPLMYFLLLNYTLYALYSGRIKTVHALAFGSVAITLFGLLTLIRGVDNFGMVVYFVANRIFLVNSDVLYSIWEMWPSNFAFMHGEALGWNLSGILPGPDVGFTRWLFDKMYRVHGNGTASSMYWGMLYADFGTTGVMLGSMLIGFIQQGIYVRYIRSSKRISSLVYYSFVIMALAQVGMSDLTTVMFQYGIVTILIFIVLFAIASDLFDLSLARTRLVRPGNRPFRYG